MSIVLTPSIMNSNIVQSHNRPDLPKEELLFRVPIGTHFPELNRIAELAAFDFDAFMEVETKAPTLSVDELRENLLALVPAARAAVGESVVINTDYMPLGSDQLIRGDRAQVSPILVHFALNALALYSIGADEFKIVAQSKIEDESATCHTSPMVVSNIDKSPFLAPRLFGKTLKRLPPAMVGAKAISWEAVSEALRFCAGYAQSIEAGTGQDWSANLDETEESTDHLNLARLGLQWLELAHLEMVQMILHGKYRDVEGYSKVLSQSDVPAYANLEAPNVKENFLHRVSSVAGGPPSSVGPMLPNQGEEPNWEECAQAFEEIAGYARHLADGGGLKVTCNLSDAIPLHNAIVTVRKHMAELEDEFQANLDSEIAFHSNLVLNYGLMKNLTEQVFEDEDGRRI